MGLNYFKISSRKFYVCLRLFAFPFSLEVNYSSKACTSRPATYFIEIYKNIWIEIEIYFYINTPTHKSVKKTKRYLRGFSNFSIKHFLLVTSTIYIGPLQLYFFFFLFAILGKIKMQLLSSDYKHWPASFTVIHVIFTLPTGSPWWCCRFCYDLFWRIFCCISESHREIRTASHSCNILSRRSSVWTFNLRCPSSQCFLMCERVPQCDALLINRFLLVPQPPLIGHRHVTWSGGEEGAGLADGAREARGHTALPRPPSAGCSHHNPRGESRRCREERAQRRGWCWQGGAAKHQEQGGGGGGRGRKRQQRPQDMRAARWGRGHGGGQGDWGGGGSTRLDLPGDALMEHGPGSRILPLPWVQSCLRLCCRLCVCVCACSLACACLSVSTARFIPQSSVLFLCVLVRLTLPSAWNKHMAGGSRAALLPLLPPIDFQMLMWLCARRIYSKLFHYLLKSPVTPFSCRHIMQLVSSAPFFSPCFVCKRDHAAFYCFRLPLI